MSNDNCSFLNMCSCPLRLERPCGLPCPELPPCSAELHQQGCTSRAAPAGLHQQGCTSRAAPAGLHQQGCTSRAAPAGLHQQGCTSRAAAAASDRA